jgi:transcriptional regulator with XRE-family HTH domain
MGERGLTYGASAGNDQQMTEVLTEAQPTALDPEEFRVLFLGDLLQRARARATVPAELRRESARSPGMTQEQAAQLLTIGERQYREFEHGGLVHPDPRFLDQVAETLAMCPAERDALYRLAAREMPPRALSRPADARALQPTLNALDEVPAMVTDSAWNILAWNRALAEQLHDPGELPVQERNSILWRFGPFGDRRFPGERANLGALVGRVRSAYIAGRGQDQLLQELVERLLAIPEASRFWHSGVLALEPPYETRILLPPGRAPRTVGALRAFLPSEGLRVTEFIPGQDP